MTDSPSSTETPATPPLLPSRNWKVVYRHEDGDLVALFYVPALSCAVCYDRMTGFFTADALALAARGIGNLVRNGGRMRLLVGCTLKRDEVRAIAEGYDLRDRIAEHMAAAPLDPPDAGARQGLEALAWMIANNRLDVKVAVPVDPETGLPVAAAGIYHEKVGIIADAEGNRICFSGSINETRGGWLKNRESFQVFFSWEGGLDPERVREESQAFERFWEGRSKSVRTLAFPEAARERLLEFLPKDDRFVTPPEPPGEEKVAAQDEPLALSPEEKRRIVWAFVRNAPRLANGSRVGEVTSAVDPWPHQRRTFQRLYDGWPCRVLISDEVGLGKTISAGLIIRQMWLEGRARRILLLTPKAVIRQWQDELYEKFNLDVPIYDGRQLVWRDVCGRPSGRTKSVGRDEWHKEPFVLCGSQLARRRDRAPELLAAEPWDLVLLDEAHHARRRGAGSSQEKGPNQLLQLMEGLSERTRALLLLTATPMQVHPVEVYDLMRLLGMPEGWTAPEFVRYFELAAGNPSSEDLRWLAERFQEAEAVFGEITREDAAAAAPGASSLTIGRILRALRDSSSVPLRRLSADDRRTALAILRRFSPVRRRMSRHTRELLRRYYREGLLASPIADRDVDDLAVQLTPAEREVYDAVEDYIGNTYNRAAKDKRSAIGFVMTIYRRRLASSFHALKQTLTNRLQKVCVPVADEDLSQDELGEDVMGQDEAEDLSREALIAEEEDAIKHLLGRIARLGTDTKALTLRDRLREAFDGEYGSAIVFTQYTDTMDYVSEFLAGQMPDKVIARYSGGGGAVRERSGSWSACSKERVKADLREGTIQVLVCTDAASEGLNLQYCGVLVNYDLPWNPMKVEQRIGRIDRIGQKYPVIRILNLAYEDTVEADVYQALHQRINLFQGIVGRLQPILARLPGEFERVALESAETRRAARERLLADVERMAREADETAFDIDEAAEAALEIDGLPEPPISLDSLELVIDREEMRPLGWEWSRLDPGTFSVLAPGWQDKLRATLNAEVFDRHIDSHVFLSPGNWLFDRFLEEAVGDDVGATDAGAPGTAGLRMGAEETSGEAAAADEGVPGRCWLLVREAKAEGHADHGLPLRMIVRTLEGFREVASLPEIVSACEQIGPPDVLPGDLRGGEGWRVVCLV